MNWGHHLIVGAALFSLGACVGSFLNVCICRIPRGLSVLRPRSRCPKCGSAIASRDNLPILGWLILRGRCRQCGLAISARYPAVEALVGALFVTAYACETLLHHGDLLDRDLASALARLCAELLAASLAVFVAFTQADRLQSEPDPRG